MSRVGKKPVAIPSGVTASVEGQLIKVKGPKGALAVALHGDVAAKVQGSEVKIDPRADTKRARAMWGAAVSSPIALSARDIRTSPSPMTAGRRSGCFSRGRSISCCSTL